MDRCPRCKGTLYFYGISTEKGIFLRWLVCSLCGTLMSTNEYGTIQSIGNKEPPKVKHERD